MTRTGIRPFFVTVPVVLEEPLPVEISDEPGASRQVSGYYINLGVNASDESEVEHVVAELVKDGRVDWADVTWRPIEELDREIRLRAANARELGIW